MKKKQCYLLMKQKLGNELIYIDYNKIEGFKIKPRNNVKYEGIEVNKLIIINPSFIDKVLKRKIKRKLDSYLQYIIMLIENNDDADADTLRIVLDDVMRYRQLIKNKYRIYLEEKYYSLLLKKIALLEQELKNKIIKLRLQYNYEDEITEKKTR
ncbi:MAG: hypothetical protein GX247_03535 [Mollicutes bacterium]|jgi:hypothetical protein|nr:hypothetical protein [Mollicutes bacterium]